MNFIVCDVLHRAHIQDCLNIKQAQVNASFLTELILFHDRNDVTNVEHSNV